MTAQIGSVGLGDFASFTDEGTRVDDAKMPFDMWFVPNPDLASLWPDERQVDFRGNAIPFYE